MKISIKIKPKLTLAGAGLGDPELITIKAIRALETADVILYDALVNKKILQNARKGSKLIYVGKRKGKHSLSQDEINRLIVQEALLHGHVVRLKGGDPFVFGRGFEELLYAENFGIPTEYIPGISSAIAAPGLAGIPVTHRGSSKSFWVITASTEKGKLNEEILLAAKSNATVVILMGLSHLKEISEIFTRERGKETAVAILQNAGLKQNKKLVSTTSEILEDANNSNIESPAVIVIGEVVKHSQRIHKLYNWQNALKNDSHHEFIAGKNSNQKN